MRLRLIRSAAGSRWTGCGTGNLGTIMRTADATGARGVILIGDCTDPYSVEAVRASMGAVFNVELAAMSEAAFLALAAGWRTGDRHGAAGKP